jgi:hypothetical protein
MRKNIYNEQLSHIIAFFSRIMMDVPRFEEEIYSAEKEICDLEHQMRLNDLRLKDLCEISRNLQKALKIICSCWRLFLNGYLKTRIYGSNYHKYLVK